MKYLSTEEAADRLGVSRNFLEKLRMTGGGPDYIRVTSRCIRYTPEALDDWMAKRVRSGAREVAA